MDLAKKRSIIRPVAAALFAVALAAASAQANMIALSAVQAATPDSTFTLSFSGNPLPSSFISNTAYVLQVDDQPAPTGAAQFLSYYQNVAPLTLPDGQGGYVNT